MVPGLSDEVRTRILERAQGIPLYAVETVRMLLDRGLVVEEGGTYRAVASLDALEVPESLHAMIAARLDGLDPSERRLLQDAAILGKSFGPVALASVSGLPLADVEASLATLVAKDLLSIQSDPRSPERGQYVFMQDLVRSVAQGTLARRDRRARHLAAAEYLEAAWVGEEGVAEVIAAHLVGAHEADPGAPDAGELRDRAGRALARAGDHATSLGALDGAQRYYERALELTVDERERAALSEKAALAARPQGRDDDALAHFRRAHSIFDALGDTARAARALTGLASIEASQGHADAAVAQMEAALAMLDGVSEEDPEGNAAIADTAARLGAQEYFRGNLHRGLEHLDRALGIAERWRLLELLSSTLNSKSWILAALGRGEEAELLEEGALRLAQSLGVSSVPVIEGNLADTLQEADRLEAAVAHFEQSAASARRLGNRVHVVFAQLGGTPALIDLGRWDRCEELVEAYFEHDAAELAAHVPTVGYAVSPVWLFLWRGRLDIAQRLVADAEAIFERSGSGSNVPVDLRALLDAGRAGVASMLGRHEEALSAARRSLDASIDFYPTMARRAMYEAIEAAFALGREGEVAEILALASRHFRAGRQPSIDALVLRWRARLSGVAGDDAAALFRRAIDAFEKLPRPFWLACTRAEFAEWLSRHGRTGEAEEHFRLARATFEELAATPWLARLDAMGGVPGGGPLEVSSLAPARG